MKNIKTLVPDIQSRLTSGKPFDEETVKAFGKALADKLSNRLSAAASKPSLRLSNLGTKCDRKLWFSIRRPELAEPLSASTRLKFLFGDILEEVMLFLARAAGHDVQREQEEVYVEGVKGHIDGFIDGHLVDVKSASTYSFRKFKEGGLYLDDPFGYLTQLGAYSFASGQERASFLVVDKTLGNLHLDTHDTAGTDFAAIVTAKREMLERSEPPARGYEDVADGKSGNRKLGVACSYCAFKYSCWPGLRAFKYARGPVFLTEVKKVPDVIELAPNEAKIGED